MRRAPDELVDTTPIRQSGIDPRQRRMQRRWIATVAVAGVLSAIGMGTGVGVVLIRAEPAAIQSARNYVSSTPPAERRQIVADVDSRFTTPAADDDASGMPRTGKTDMHRAAAPKRAGGSAAKPTEPAKSGVVLPNTPAGTVDQILEGDHGDSVRVVHLSKQELNVWLGEKLPAWMADRGYQMPKQFGDPVITVDDGRLAMAFDFHSPHFSQLFSAEFDLTFMDNGNARVKLANIRAGQLPLPTSIGGYIATAGAGTEESRKAGAWIDKLQYAELKPVFKLAPGHKVRVLGYQVVGDGIDLTVRNEAPTGATATAATPASRPAM